MRRHITYYVRKELFARRDVSPSSDRRFFPTAVDYRNYIYRARLTKLHSKVDQVNLKLCITKWSEQFPNISSTSESTAPRIHNKMLSVIATMLRMQMCASRSQQRAYCSAIRHSGRSICHSAMEMRYVFSMQLIRHLVMHCRFSSYVWRQTWTMQWQHLSLYSPKTVSLSLLEWHLLEAPSTV